jgi:hypothetical protein
VPWRLGGDLKFFFFGERHLKWLVVFDDNFNIFSCQRCKTKKLRDTKNTE